MNFRRRQRMLLLHLRARATIKMYVKRILLLVLIVSGGQILYDHFITFPNTLHKVQAAANNIRVEAFESWRGKMELVKNILNRAETRVDVLEASEHTSWATVFARIFTNGINFNKDEKKLYYWVSRATWYLYTALDRVYSRTYDGIDQNILSMIGNVTTNIENLESKTGGPRYNLMRFNGVEPAQQLREAEVLTDVLNYLEQIFLVSVDIYNYYE